MLTSLLIALYTVLSALSNNVAIATHPNAAPGAPTEKSSKPVTNVDIIGL
jgi:hypothetical protein